jgi:hypothetical protein
MKWTKKGKSADEIRLHYLARKRRNWDDFIARHPHYSEKYKKPYVYHFCVMKDDQGYYVHDDRLVDERNGKLECRMAKNLCIKTVKLLNKTRGQDVF